MVKRENKLNGLVFERVSAGEKRGYENLVVDRSKGERLNVTVVLSS